MPNEFIYQALEPTVVPATWRDQLADVLNIFRDRKPSRSMRSICVPSSDDKRFGYFRVKRLPYSAELEPVAPGTILSPNVTVLVIEYGKPWHISLSNCQMRRAAGGRYEIHEVMKHAIITIHLGFSQAAMTELLNRWICACALGHVQTSPYAILSGTPDSRPFDDYKPDTVRDGISFVRSIE